MPPVGGDDEKNTASRQRNARDDCPSGAKSQLRNLCGDKPDPGEQDQQEPDLGEAYARVSRDSNDGVHAHSILRRRLHPRSSARFLGRATCATRRLLERKLKLESRVLVNESGPARDWGPPSGDGGGRLGLLLSQRRSARRARSAPAAARLSSRARPGGSRAAGRGLEWITRPGSLSAPYLSPGDRAAA